MKVYIGSYTKRDSKGIYIADFNKGKLETPTLFANVDNPTYLQIDKKNNILYCNNTKGQKAGITSYRLFDGSKPLSESLTTNKNSCYLELNIEDSLIYSVIYSDGILESRNFVPSNGHILSPSFKYIAQGSGFDKIRQEKSHLHISTVYNDLLFVCDLGDDSILVFEKSNLRFLQKIILPPGTGPRHIVFNKKYSYVITELSNQVFEVENIGNNNFRVNRVFNLIDKDYGVISQSSAIKISPNKKFLYTSVRGANIINVFSLYTDGRINKLLFTTPTYGDWCRDFEITPDNEYLLAVHEKSYNISIFKIFDDGSIRFIDNSLKAPEATCIKII